MTPEQQARQNIETLLQQAGWHVCDMANANIHASRGVALREFPLNPGYGFADYLLYIDGKAAGVIEAKKEGATLTGVEVQSARYAQGLPATLPAWRRPLPFSYESTGVETHAGGIFERFACGRRHPHRHEQHGHPVHGKRQDGHCPQVGQWRWLWLNRVSRSASACCGAS